MADIQTYNNIIDIFRDIANRHYQIADFFVGDIWEEDANTRLYPLLVVNPVSALMEKSDNGYATFEITMDVQISDQVFKSEANETDVKSDTLQMLQDIIVEFNQHPFYTNSRFDITNDLNFETFTEKNDDELTGWTVQIILRTPNIRKFCGIPVSEISGFSFDRPDNSTSGASGLNLNIKGLTATYPIIITKTGDSYKWEIDDPLNYVASTGGTFSGAINFEQTVHIQNNIIFSGINGTAAANLEIDLSLGNIFIYDFPVATLVDYTNAQIGTYIFILKNQTTNSAISFSFGKWATIDGEVITVTATTGATDVFTGVFDGEKMILFEGKNIITI